jgi:tetratricopeptide (TPR) repeat protein
MCPAQIKPGRSGPKGASSNGRVDGLNDVKSTDIQPTDMLWVSLPARPLAAPGRVAALLAAGVALLGLAPIAAVGQGASPAPPTLQQGLQAYQDGRYETAIPLLREAVAASPAQPRAHAALSLALLQTGQVDKARQAVVKGQRVAGPHPFLRLARAEVLMRQEAHGEALSIYRELRTQVSSSSAASSATRLTPELLRRRTGQAHQQLGRQAYAQGDTARAQRHFETALDQAPEALSVYANLGVLHLKQGRPEHARTLAEQGLRRLDQRAGGREADPSALPDEARAALTGRLLRLKASALQATGDAEAVAAVYERLADRRPQDVAVQIGYAQALISAGNRREGLKRFRALLDRFPGDRRVYDALIDLYDRYRNAEAALQVLRRMQTRFPEDPDVLRRIAERLEDLGRLDRAHAAYDSLLTRTGDTLQVAQARARLFEAQDSLAAAADQYRRALRQRLTSSSLPRDLGRVLEQAGRWTEALAVYRAWADRSDGPAPHMHQGRAHEHLGRTDSAAAAYRTALDRGSDHPLPAARLARMYYRKGNADAAFEQAVTALRQGLEGEVSLGGASSRSTSRSATGRPSGPGGPADSVRTSDAPEVRAGGVLTAQQRRRRRSARRWRRSVDRAFHLLTRHHSRSRIEPVLDTLLAEHPNAGRLHLLVGTYYEDEGALAAARRHLRRAATLTPRRPAGHRAMGRVAAAQGDTTSAIRAYKRALSADPEALGARQALIDLYRQQGRLDALIRRWRRRYDTRPTDALREALLEAYHKAGRYEAARTLAVPDSSR